MHHAPIGPITLCYDTVGPSGGPAVLLISGLGSQMIAWPPALLEDLAQRGMRVIWFDNRDVGASTWLDEAPAPTLSEITGMRDGPHVEPVYRLADMAADSIGLLDRLDVPAAHIVGVSMGGMIAQRLALHHPDRVASLTSIMSTTGARGLPRATPAANNALLQAAPTGDRDAYVDAQMAKREVLGSTGLSVDETWTRQMLARGFDRGLNAAGFLRQYHAIMADGDRSAALATIDTPTHVIHGTDDPLVRVEAGRATAAAIPGATIREVAGMGHDLPPAACSMIADDLEGLVTRS